MDNLDFSEEEIQEQLAALGYKNIPKHRLCEFKQDLDDLVRRGEWKSFASSAQINAAKSQTAAPQPSPPAFTKEKVGRCHFGSSAEGFFLHARKVDHDRRALTACQNRDYEQPQGGWDSYARHSVALNLRLPPGAPSRLQEEPDPEESLQPPLTGSYTSTPDSHRSTPDSHRGRFVKRKVLRKHKGQSLVCDESVYSEEAPSLSRRLRRALTSAGVVCMQKMYSAQWDEDQSSLSSSFWSDGGRQEGEEEEGVVGEGDLKPVGNGEESHRVASGEKEGVISEEDSKAVCVSEDSHREASGEEEVERESKPVTDAQDSLQDASEKEEEEDSNPLSDSEDSYQEDSEKEDNSNPLSDSEDSYQEDSEEIEQVISEEESKSVGDVKDHLQESSEEEEDSNPLSDSEDSYQEDSEEEDDSKPVSDAEDYLQEASEEDSNPLSDSGDSYQEDSEEIEEESKPVGDADGHLQEASKEEEDPKLPGNSEEVEHVICEEESKSVADVKDDLEESSEKEEDSNPLSDSEESYQEDSEGMEIERVISEEEFKPVGDADDHLQEASKEEEDSNPPGDSEHRYQEASEEEKPELNNQVNISGKSLEGGDDDEEEECSSSDSPAPSLMTSGYGTYKPEELEGGDDQDSRGDLSEMRDDEEDDRSLSSFGWFDLKPAEPDPAGTRPTSVLEDGEPESRRDADLRHEVTEEDGDQAREEEFEVHLHEATSGEQQFCNAVVKEKVDVKSSAGGREEDDDDEDDELLEEDAQDREEEKEIEDKVELEDPDESSSNKDIKFIDSNVDFSHMTFDKMCADWEGNLRQKKKKTASSLEEQLADLHLSSSARRDFETEIEDAGAQTDGQSSETDGVSLSAFESYMRCMTRTQSDGDLRPKPKSFIRPVMSQQTIKKTDPVAKYFKYKQLWEMFQLPGEKDRRSLRWEIKERLAYRPPPPKPRRVYEPNGYVVPTEKKRSALRWEVRNDLAHRLLPHKFSSQC